MNDRSANWRTVFALAWPVWIQQLLILTVALSDQWLAGNFEPADPEQQVAYQAALTTGIYLGWMINSYTILVSVGATALVARFVGAGDVAAANHACRQSILLAALLGILGTIFGLAVLPTLLALLELHGPAGEFALEFLQPLFLFLPFMVIETACIASLAGAGDTRTGLWVLGGVAVVNVPLAWGFFLGMGPFPALGFAGIGLGTALSHLLGCLAVSGILWHGRAGLRLRFRRLLPDLGMLRRLLSVSIPAGIDSLSGVLCQFWFLSLINRLGEAASSAHGIALRWEAFAYLSGGAFGTAAMTLIGQNLGAQRPDLARRGGWLAFRMGALVMAIMGAVFYVFAPQLFEVFCPFPSQRPVIEEGVPVLRMVAFFMPALACTIVLTPALRGAGDTRVPLLFTWVGFLGIRIPLAYLLALDEFDLGPLGVGHGLGLGLLGAWWAMVADIVIRGGFFLYRFAGGRWQRIQV